MPAPMAPTACGGLGLRAVVPGHEGVQDLVCPVIYWEAEAQVLIYPALHLSRELVAAEPAASAANFT